jgi:hypothetical protein
MAAGMYTSTLPVVGSTLAPSLAGFGGAAGLMAIDTQTANGGIPQTVSISLTGLTALIASMTVSAQTSTVHAATSNTPGILVTTESLSTAAGADYTFTWTNSLLVAGSPAPSVSMIGLSNTGGQITLKSVTNAVGSTVIIWTNTGTTAFNGTMLIAGHI